jgi:hypothetical protein
MSALSFPFPFGIACCANIVALQVPLLVGKAFCSAAQHRWDSPAAVVALSLIDRLLRTAEASGITKGGTAVGSLGTSMQQQLQQAGVLQQLAVVMTALNADMRQQTDLIRRWSVDELCSHLNCFSATKGSVAQLAVVYVAAVYTFLRMLRSDSTRTRTANSMSWLCDPIGHAEIAMQLCTTALQHASSVLQYAVPALKQRGHNDAAVLLLEQQPRVSAVSELGRSVMMDLYHTVVMGAGRLPGQSSPAPTDAQAQQQQLQRLLLSPHCLPCVASQLVLHASWANRSGSLQAACTAGSSQGQGGSCAGSSRDNEGRDSGGSSRSSSVNRHQGQQQLGAAGDGPSSSSSGMACSEPPTPCQLQLLELLGLVPQLATSAEQPPSRHQAINRLTAVVNVCGAYHNAVLGFLSSSSGQQSDVQRGLQGQQQRWQFEQQLCLLLPAVMLPCASNILLLLAADTPNDPLQQPVEVAACAAELLRQSNQTVFVSSRLHFWLGQQSSSHRLPHPGWIGEVVGGVLQLADRLLLLQPPELQSQAAAAPAAAPGSQRSSSTTAAPATPTNISTHHVWQNGLSMCASYWSELLAVLVIESNNWCLSGSSTASPHGSSDSSAAADRAQVVAVSVPALAARFVEVCTALETGLQLVTIAKQSNMMQRPCGLIASGIPCLFLIHSSGDRARGPLAMHMGMRGTAALASELRHLYSLVSSLQKLGCCRAGVAHELCWGQQVADTWCWAAAVAAVGLLQSALPAAATAAAATAATPAAAGEQSGVTPAAVKEQQPEVEYLPTLVIFGRCLLVWAAQLQQQIPELLLLLGCGTGLLQQQQEAAHDGVQAEHSAASICVPGLQPIASCGLQRSMATVSSWVGGLTSPEAHAALAAAAGGDLQQFRQQLEALSAAQAALLQEGVRDASLTALVQQLQATGVMLSSIAVPHFCNNPACVNISGATEVQLVSGCSCICAGCRTARYCGRVCQRQAWPQHKAVCKALAVAAACDQ